MDDLETVSLRALTKESRSMLSDLLNPKKVIPIIGPDKLSRHRDWRGLASLIKISSEKAASISDHADRTGKVLDIWQKRNDGTAVVGRLLTYLQILDRYDVYDDILERARDKKLVVVRSKEVEVEQEFESFDESDEDLITFDDALFGRPQRYHAYVLYVDHDKPFVDELLYRTRNEGFKMCTEEDLRAGYGTKFEPISRLITERCRYIIFVYSPDFIESPAINFCMNLAQADAIIKKQIKLIPIMYRPCILPSHIAHYHCLRYNVTTPYDDLDFWERLRRSLIYVAPRSNGKTRTYSQMKELPWKIRNGFNHPITSFSTSYLTVPKTPRDISSASLNDLPNQVDTSITHETRSLGTTSQSSDSKKKKSGTFRNFLRQIRDSRKNHKKAVSLKN